MQVRGTLLDICLADLASALLEQNRPAAGYRKLLASITLPSRPPSASVIDRVLAIEQAANKGDEPDWLISTMVHKEITNLLSVYVVESFT